MSTDRTLRTLIARMDPGGISGRPPTFKGTARSLMFTTTLPEAAAGLTMRNSDVTLAVDESHQLELLWLPHYRTRTEPAPSPGRVVLLHDVDRLEIGLLAGFRGRMADRVARGDTAETDPYPDRVPRQRTTQPRHRRYADARPVAAMNRQRGFALLIVLWTMGLLALLVAQFTATGRTEVQMAANLRANAVTEAAADGAVYEAILRLLQGTWAPDGRVRAIRVGTADVEVRIKDQAWKVNPNDAKLPALQALLGHLGVEAAKGTALARAIVDWHSDGAAPRPGGPRLSRNRAAGRPLPRETSCSTASTRSGWWLG